MEDFTRNSKLTIEQNIWVVNHLQIGTSLEIFQPDKDNRGWCRGVIKSIEWKQNLIHFLVNWDDSNTYNSILHLDITGFEN